MRNETTVSKWGNSLAVRIPLAIAKQASIGQLVLALDGGTGAAVFHSPETRHLLFWLFLGGFAWVIGDLFQQFATKYLGIGRAIPLSNTNQLWGLAWGALVFGELAHADWYRRLLVVAGSLVMILGALAVSTAIATEREHASMNSALVRECSRYHLDYDRVMRAYSGAENGSQPGCRPVSNDRRGWWDYAILAAAVGVFVYLGWNARVPALSMNFTWLWILAGVLIASAATAGWGLWKATRFS